MISHYYNIANSQWEKILYNTKVVGYYKTIIDKTICPTSKTLLFKVPAQTKFQHHEHEYIHVFYFSDGEGDVYLDNEIIPIKPGLVVVVEPFQRHAIINTSTEDLIFFAVQEEEHKTDQKLPYVDF